MKVNFGDKQWNFSGVFTKQGQTTFHVLQQEIPVILATVPGKGKDAPKVNPDNPRLLDDFKEKATQTNLKAHIHAMYHGQEIKSSLDFHGGLNEPLMVHNSLFVEGNRRATELLGTTDEILAWILPDEMTPEQIMALITTKHTGGHYDWSSYVKSKTAYEFRTIHKWSWEDIMKQCQFSSLKATKKYVTAYVWFMKSGLLNITDKKGDAKFHSDEWSKFHHACVPTLEKHWGYNNETCEFDSQEAAKADTIGADVVAGHATDFPWFVNLIKDGKLTDCREPDGLVAPLVRDAANNEPYAGRIFQVLDAPVKSTNGQRNATNADEAWKMLREYRQGGWLVRQIATTTQMLQTVQHDPKKVSELKTQGDASEELAKLRVLVIEANKLLKMAS